MNESETEGSYRLFSLKYKQFTIVGGGKPALILAVGAPLAIIAIVAMVFNVLNQWLLLAVILVDIALFSVLAGIWIWRDTRACCSPVRRESSGERDPAGRTGHE